MPSSASTTNASGQESLVDSMSSFTMKVPEGKANRNGKPITYLDLPTEIRAMVIHMLWESDGYTTLRLQYTKPKSRRQCYLGYGAFIKEPRPGKSRDIFAMLRVCRLSRLDAATFLYGHCHFSSYDTAGVICNFVPWIGSFNAALLRSLSLSVPDCMKSNPRMITGRFLHTICNRLVGLDELWLTTRFPLSQMAEAGVPQFAKEERALLAIAALVTSEHPRLEKALWLAFSGVYTRFGEQHVELFLKIMSCGAKNFTEPHPRATMRLVDRSSWDHSSTWNQKETKDILLDCEAIWNIPWPQLLFRHAQEFETTTAVSNDGHLTGEGLANDA